LIACFTPSWRSALNDHALAQAMFLREASTNPFRLLHFVRIRMTQVP